MITLTKLRQAIIKEIPEIVELKFGCRLKNKYQSDDNPYQIKTFIKKNGFGQYECLEYDGRSFTSRSDTFEIIGRKITLADVLRVVFDKKRIIINSPRISLIKLIVMKWNLSKNDLNLQSKETINFLSKIILKGE